MNIKHMQGVTDSLLGKIIKIPNERGGYTSFQLFKKCTVDKDELNQWYIEIDAHDDALPLMFDFKREYFSYELWNALKLKSSNQLRMYELLKQYEAIGERKITLKDLREFLCIGSDEYPRWDNFKRRVLDSCKESLKEHTDLCFDYEPIRAGRKITGIKFIIKKNTEYVDQLSLDDFLEQQTIEADYEITEIKDAEIKGSIYSEALPDELTETQVEYLRALAVNHVNPFDNGPLPYECRVADYLSEKVSLMEAQPEQIENKFAWLKKAVAEDWR